MIFHRFCNNRDRTCWSPFCFPSARACARGIHRKPVALQNSCKTFKKAWKLKKIFLPVQNCFPNWNRFKPALGCIFQTGVHSSLVCFDWRWQHCWWIFDRNCSTTEVGGWKVSRQKFCIFLAIWFRGNKFHTKCSKFSRAKLGWSGQR